MVWGRVTDWTDSVCEIGLPLYGLLLRARALGSPQSIGNTKKTSQKAEFIQILHEAGLIVAERICVRMWL